MIDGIPVEIIVYNPVKKSKHKCPCILPLDALEMSQEQIEKAYTKHFTQAIFDLMQHKSFRKGLAKQESKLIIE